MLSGTSDPPSPVQGQVAVGQNVGMAADSPGQGPARRFYWQEVSPRLAGTLYAAALLGDGSEVLGYDDEVSTDHDFGPRVQVFLAREADQAAMPAALAGLPERFESRQGHFSRAYPYDGWLGHQVESDHCGEPVHPGAIRGMPRWSTWSSARQPATVRTSPLRTSRARYAAVDAGRCSADPCGEHQRVP